MDLRQSPPSLEKQAMIRIVINILTSEEMIRFLARYRAAATGSDYSEGVWDEGLEMAEELARGVYLSSDLGYELVRMVKPIFSNITNWIITNFFENTLDYNQLEYCLSKLRFAPEGCVDQQKTADVLIDDENVGIGCRYILACAFASESHIRSLWRKMSPSEFYNKDVDEISCSEMPLTAFWSFYMEGQHQKLVPLINNGHPTPFEYALLESAKIVGSLSSTSYFWDKLSPEQKLRTMKEVVKVTTRSRGSDVLIFILSQMNVTKQKELLIDDEALYVLETLLQWPHQEIFLRAAMFIQESITPERFLELLKTMTRTWTFDYQKVFRAFWHQSPVEWRRYVIQDDQIIELMEILFMQDYYEAVLVLWSEFQPDEKENKFIRITHRLVRELKNSVLYPLTNLFLPTPFAADKFKNQMDEHARLESVTNPEPFQIWNKHGRFNLYHCIDSCFQEFNA